MIGVPARKVPKRRYNLTLKPTDVELMDRVADGLDCSRSELLAYCFGYWFEHVYNKTADYNIRGVDHLG